MKPSNFKLLSFFVSLAASFSIIYFGFPLWTFVLLVPTLIYTQLLFSNNYTFRDSIGLEPVPEIGYQKRLQVLEHMHTLLRSAGFIKFDEFYLRTANDMIAFVYRHKKLPVIACHYNLERINLFDLTTKFDRGYRLTTTNADSVHLIETSNENMVQAFPAAGIEELIQRHCHSVNFLRHRGINAQPTNPFFFRKEFLREFIEQGQQLKGLLGPITSLYRMFFGNKHKQTRSIQEQFLARTLFLP